MTKPTLLIPLALLSAAVVTQTNANWFNDPSTGLNRNVGSAPNPTLQELRETRPIPGYPTLSRLLKEQGKVGLSISLNEDGTVSAARVAHSSGFARLDDAAIQYMKVYWHYQPVNKPMPARVRADVIFKLQ